MIETGVRCEMQNVGCRAENESAKVESVKSRIVGANEQVENFHWFKTFVSNILEGELHSKRSSLGGHPTSHASSMAGQ